MFPFEAVVTWGDNEAKFIVVVALEGSLEQQKKLIFKTDKVSAAPLPPRALPHCSPLARSCRRRTSSRRSCMSTWAFSQRRARNSPPRSEAGRHPTSSVACNACAS